MGMAVAGNWTYSGDPANSTRDQVRFLVGDTDDNDQQASDEEIAWTISTQPNVYMAASMVALGVAARYSNLIESKTVDGLSISYGARKDNFEALASRLAKTAQAATNRGFAAYAGGISKADKDLQEADSDWNQPYFKLGMHDFLESEWTVNSDG